MLVLLGSVMVTLKFDCPNTRSAAGKGGSVHPVLPGPFGH
jgi:hypothetical protein